MIATDVGAVAEIINDRVDGFLVRQQPDETRIVADFVAVIEELRQDRTLLHAVSLAAMERAGALAWDRTMAELFAKLGEMLEDKAA